MRDTSTDESLARKQAVRRDFQSLGDVSVACETLQECQMSSHETARGTRTIYFQHEHIHGVARMG